ncbi:MAG: hypothetical protein MI747_04915, partial [Desulfobacterales bacterium]|nr:hypothetical protein [Desulfobacterales bacterium]
LALCCTHFGYRRELFIQAMEAVTQARVHILNPNEAMSQNALAPYKSRDMGNAPEIMELNIVSRVPWEDARIQAYEKLFASRSPRVVQALKNYELTPDLFPL